MIEEGQRIRVVFHHFTKEDAVTVLRGDVLACDGTLLKIQGRRFGKVLDPNSSRAEEKPLDGFDKCFVVPLGAIRFLEMIAPGSPEAELDERIRSEPMIRRKGSFALLD